MGGPLQKTHKHLHASFAVSFPSIVFHSLRDLSIRSHKREKLRPTLSRDLIIEPFDVEDFSSYAAAWRQLADQAVEPNIFMDPDFAMPAALHMPRALRPQFIAIWGREANGLRGRLLSVWALETKGSTLSSGLGRCWRFRHAALGAPLIDRQHGGFVILAFLDWLHQSRPNLRALHVSHMPSDSQLFQLFLSCASENKRPYAILNQHDRAVRYRP